jgi:hypothetical protein
MDLRDLPGSSPALANVSNDEDVTHNHEPQIDEVP